MRLVAVGAAVLAMVFTLVAVIVVLMRDGGQVKPSAQPASTLRDHVVRASDVVRLRSDVEVVVDAGTAKGLRVKDATLAQALGLDAGDVITALSGKPMLSERRVRCDPEAELDERDHAVRRRRAQGHADAAALEARW